MRFELYVRHKMLHQKYQFADDIKTITVLRVCLRAMPEKIEKDHLLRKD